MADFLDQRASEDGLEGIEGVGIFVPARSYLGATSSDHDGDAQTAPHAVCPRRVLGQATKKHCTHFPAYEAAGMV